MLVGKVDQDRHLIEGYIKYFLGKSLPPLNQNYFQHVILVESTDYEIQIFRLLPSWFDKLHCLLLYHISTMVLDITTQSHLQ
jgi:hypothetical protein